jgi:hypothetical protein
MRGQSGGEDFELLGQGRIRIEGVPRLSLAHHVNHFDSGQHGGGGGRRFEAEHRPDTAFDAPMVLLDPIVQVLTPADPDRLQLAPGANGEAKRFFELSDRQLHEIICYCHFGAMVNVVTAARHIRAAIAGREPGMFARLHEAFVG